MPKGLNNRKKINAKEERLKRVAVLYKRGYTFRQIREEILKDPDAKTYSLQTVKRDVDSLLKEWRECRIEDTDLAVQAELEKINDQERELWEAWDKSKTDFKTKLQRQKAEKGNGRGGGDKLTQEKTEKDEINFGDARYQAELTKLGQERRKLLGLYAAEKKEITGKDGSPIFNGFDTFMAGCLEVAENDAETNEAIKQETTDSAG